MLGFIPSIGRVCEKLFDNDTSQRKVSLKPPLFSGLKDLLYVMLPFNSIVSTRVWSKLCSTSMLNVEAKSSCEPALAASTSATVRSIVSSTTPGSMTIIGLTSRLADCITGVPPSAGIACTQTDTVSPIALWSTGSSGIFSLGTSM